ncbi:hypothetical protein SAMN05216576_12264, partial [Ectopseudomonas chengduensis]
IVKLLYETPDRLAVWGFFFAVRKTARQKSFLQARRGAARTDKDADMPLRMAHPAVDPLTLRE